MTGPTYRYEQKYSFLKKNIKHSFIESLTDGTNKGIEIKYIEKIGDAFYKFIIKEVSKDTFEIIETIKDNKNPPRSITEKDILKLLKDKKLDNMINYIKNERGTYKGKNINKIKFKVNGYDNLA